MRTEQTPLNEDFRDLLKSFAAAEARFLVVGAYALAVHGIPRATGDIDLWVDATPDNAKRVFAALRAFGAPMLDVTEADFATPDIVYQIGLPPRRVDILTKISGVTFAEAWPRRIESRFGETTFGVLGRDDLLVNKRAAGRPKDVIDAALLEKLPR